MCEPVAATISVHTEYTEVGSSTEPVWTKQYVYLGARLLAVMQPSGGGNERVEFHHPDKLGTRLVTSSQDGSYYEQVTLPFGTALDVESTGASNRRFTSYDRSAVTGLDYAINRHYDPLQGRFIQPDPIGMKATNLINPQSLNMYSYCANDPINHVDPDGLFFGKLFRAIGNFFKKHWKVILAVAAVVAVVAVTVGFGAIIGAVKSGLAAVGQVGIAAGAASWTEGIGRGASSIFLGTLISSAIAGLGSIVQSRRQRRRRTAQRIGGEFPPDKAAILEGLKERVRQLLQNPDCAALLGGVERAQALLQRAQIFYADTINPNYKGPGYTVAQTARTLALSSNSNVVAYAEVNGTRIYLNSRFFNIDTSPLPNPIPPGGVRRSVYSQETIFIHELRHNNGLPPEPPGGSAEEDYAKIEQACGTKPPYRQ